MCNEKPKARAKLKAEQLPDAPEPSRAEHIDIPGGVRSSATIVRSKLISNSKKQRREVKNEIREK